LIFRRGAWDFPADTFVGEKATSTTASLSWLVGEVIGERANSCGGEEVWGETRGETERGEVERDEDSEDREDRGMDTGRDREADIGADIGIGAERGTDIGTWRGIVGGIGGREGGREVEGKISDSNCGDKRGSVGREGTVREEEEEEEEEDVEEDTSELEERGVSELICWPMTTNLGLNY